MTAKKDKNKAPKTDPKTIDVIRRAHELKTAGKGWPEIVEILESEGFKDRDGKPYQSGNLRGMYSRNKPQEAPQSKTDKVVIVDIKTESKKDNVDMIDKINEAIDSKVGMVVKDMATREEVTQMLMDMENRIMQSVQAQAVKVDIDDTNDMPLPPKTGKKYHGSKEDIRARVDSNLYALLDDMCKSRFKGNMSIALDHVLWTFFGKPLLSFQEGTAHEGSQDS